MLQRSGARQGSDLLDRSGKSGSLWTQRVVGLTGVVALLAYVAWIGGPYVYSVIVRDAAVTTWISVVASPIEGYFDKAPLYPGTRVGEDGRIATIENPLADATPVARAEADLARIKHRIAVLESTQAVLREEVEARTEASLAYATSFRQDIDRRVAAAAESIAHTEKRLELERIQSARLAKLAKVGHASQAAADAAQGVVLDLERTLTTLKAEHERATVRQEGAKRGVFLLDDGEDGGAYVARSLEDVRVDLARASLDLESAKVEAASAERVLAETKASYEKARHVRVDAPPGAMVWSRMASPGAPVQPGTPLMSWIDCGIMLVDVPVSDVELALLSIGDAADVVIEGEHHVRHGTVLLERGAAATMGLNDLVAVAKGRHPGVGQVLVKLAPAPADIKTCPIGHAAYVDFPGVGLWDIVKAMLRF